MLTHILAGLVGAAISFAVTRIANKLNGTDTLRQDYNYLKGLYAKLVAKVQGQSQGATAPATPSA